jgi:hypothetical protein
MSSYRLYHTSFYSELPASVQNEALHMLMKLPCMELVVRLLEFVPTALSSETPQKPCILGLAALYTMAAPAVFAIKDAYSLVGPSPRVLDAKPPGRTVVAVAYKSELTLRSRSRLKLG